MAMVARTARRVTRRWFTSAILLLLPAGCAGYRFGPTAGVEAGARSIQVNPFQNRTREPRLGETVTQAVRQRLQQDGTYRLATRRDGDIIVHGVLTRYDRAPLTFQPGDVITPRDFEATLYAHVIAEERATGRRLLDREVKGRITFRIVDDQTSSERQAAPVLSDDLANNITALLVDGEW